MLRTGPLYHGGVMVNYRCTAACRHCLYACSPGRGGGYLGREKAREICGVLKQGRIGSVHIGGGEPFLDFEGLLAVIDELGAAGIALDYIETNAYWARVKTARQKLERLLGAGVRALCISVDPYHAEYVPYGRPLLLAKLCRAAGMGYFLWKEEFLPALSGLAADRIHSRGELQEALGRAYIRDTAAAYAIGMGGRAVNIEEEYARRRPARELTDEAPCGRLFSTGHFHVDNQGWFIPPRCTGLRIPLNEAVRGLEPGRYPVYEALAAGGIAELLYIARREGFAESEEGYASKCNLCFHARAFLAARGGFAELDAEHYAQSLEYY
ncbi:MAG: 4Fe-4S cluster-binding domain-containing protein [Spirochaetales bacterium]|jgi:hypothetical protein|nr:4Fe-4S cluster-binding domain-containing protein [Spirochaetales bacterium]